MVDLRPLWIQTVSKSNSVTCTPQGADLYVCDLLLLLLLIFLIIVLLLLTSTRWLWPVKLSCFGGCSRRKGSSQSEQPIGLVSGDQSVYHIIWVVQQKLPSSQPLIDRSGEWMLRCWWIRVQHVIKFEMFSHQLQFYNHSAASRPNSLI